MKVSSHRLKTISMLAVATALIFAHPAAAEYPDRPITMVVGFSPGGSTDQTARLLATFLQKELGGNTSVLVENRPGAGGENGFRALAEAKPDGYTIGFVNTPHVLTLPIERKTRFNWQSYDLLGNVVDDPANFSVPDDSDIKSLADLVAYAKAHPGEVTVGTTGIGSDDHLAMLAFQRIAGVEMTHIPYKGAADVRTALAGRHIMMGAMNIGEAMAAQAGGTPIRNLGQMSLQRSEIAPDVPTFKEQGFDMVFNSLRGTAAPKGLPSPIRERLVTAVAKVAADPEFQAKMKESYTPMWFLTPDEFAATLQKSDNDFRALWKENPWVEK
jgi:tripartite-type tricarboxylate transporter receptor subunit TctC